MDQAYPLAVDDLYFICSFHLSQYLRLNTYRIFNECSCFNEFIKQVGFKR